MQRSHHQDRDAWKAFLHVLKKNGYRPKGHGYVRSYEIELFARAEPFDRLFTIGDC